jgi:hypothetical protein
VLFATYANTPKKDNKNAIFLFTVSLVGVAIGDNLPCYLVTKLKGIQFTVMTSENFILHSGSLGFGVWMQSSGFQNV